jgi:hypothetical protein
MYISYVSADVDILYKSAQHFVYQDWRAWNAAIEAIFGRWELVVVDNVYIRNGSGSNIGAQTYNNYQSRYTSQSIDQSQLIFPLLDVLLSCGLDRVSYRLSKL